MDIRGEIVMCDIVFEKNIPSDLLITIENSICENNIKVVDKIRYEFDPQGLTKVWILSASHLSLHTYPESNYISIDCYTCDGEGSASRVINYILARYNNIIKKVNLKKFNRGIFD